jgi:hypothetical protein
MGRLGPLYYKNSNQLNNQLSEYKKKLKIELFGSSIDNDPISQFVNQTTMADKNATGSGYTSRRTTSYYARPSAQHKTAAAPPPQAPNAAAGAGAAQPNPEVDKAFEAHAAAVAAGTSGIGIFTAKPEE